MTCYRARDHGGQLELHRAGEFWETEHIIHLNGPITAGAHLENSRRRRDVDTCRQHLL